MYAKWTHSGRPRCDIQSICTTRSNDTVPSCAGYARSSKLISEMGSRGRRTALMTRLEESDFISGEIRLNDPAVERNSENMGRSVICRSVRHNSENKVQFRAFGLSVRMCDSSKARITRGHRDPSSESNTDRGSMNLQSNSPVLL